MRFDSRFLALAALFALVFTGFAVWAVAQSAASAQTVVSAGTQNQAFNFSIANLNVSHKVQQVNITLPADFVFVTGSARNNVSGNNASLSVTFYNATTGVPAGTGNLTWQNLTDYVINVTEAANFSFLADVPQVNGSVDFLVWTLDNQTSRVINLTTVVVLVNDTTAPTVTLDSPADNQNTTLSTIPFVCSATENALTLSGARLWANWSAGAWHANATNTSADLAIANATNFSIAGIADGYYVWNCQFNDTNGNAAFAAANRTIWVDRTPPDIGYAPNNPADNGNVSLVTVTFNITVADTTPIFNCTFVMDSGSNETATITSSPKGCTFTNNSMTQGFHTYRFWVNDSAGNINASANRTIGAFPDLTVLDIVWTWTNATNGRGPAENDNITGINATIINLGHFNITPFTVENISVKLFFNNTERETVNVTNSTLVNGTPVQVNFTTTINSTETINTIYPIRVDVDTFDFLAEASEANNTRSEDLFVGFNVTIIQISNSTPFVGQNITLNVTVRFANGTGVAGLNLSNFTTLDSFGGSVLQSWSSNATPLGASFTDLGSGQYSFNITTYNVTNGDTKAGVHNLTIQVVEIPGNWSGASGGADFYNLTAPNFVISYSGIPGSMTANQHVTGISMTVTNTGNVNATVNVTSGGVQGHYVSIQNFTCAEQEIAPGGQATICSAIAIKADSVSSTQTGKVNITVNASFGGVEFKRTTESGGFSINPASSTDSSSSSSSSSTTTTTTVTKTCATDSECAFTEFCSAGVCTALVCKSDEVAENHKCVPIYGMTITPPAFVELLPGASTKKNFGVKASGKSPVTKVSLALTLPANLNWTNWTTITPASVDSIAVDAEATFEVEIRVPEDATVFIHNITAVSTSEEGGLGTATFQLRVLATEAAKVALNDTFAKLAANVTDEERILKELIEKFENNTNVTEANATFTEVQQLVAEAQAALEAGDYPAAAVAIKKAQDLLAQAQSKTQAERATVAGFGLPFSLPPLSPLTIAIIAGGAGGAAVVAYILTHGGFGRFKPARAGAARPAPQAGKQSIFQRIKDAIRKRFGKRYIYKPG